MKCTVVWTPEKKDEAIAVLTKYFEMYGCGERIMQSDEALIDAPEMLSVIADDILVDGEGIISDHDDDDDEIDWNAATYLHDEQD